MKNEYLIYCRKRKGLTQKQLAERTGKHLRTIQKYEGGEVQIQNMSAQSLARLAAALGTTVEEILAHLPDCAK